MSAAPDRLLAYVQDRPVINTHSHHLYDDYFADFGLDALFNASYVDWNGIPLCQTDRARYIDRVRSGSYFVWLKRGEMPLRTDHPRRPLGPG